MNEETTEERIKSAARKVFIRKGMTGARMQEIADEAGINKALLHYYYRSKDGLFNTVFEEVVLKFVPELFALLNSDIPLEVKVYQAAEKYAEMLSEHREMPLFILNELQTNPERLTSRLPFGRNTFSALENQLKEEYKMGRIRNISPEMFLMNLISMMVFPFAAKPLFQKMSELDDEAYAQFLESRKKEVPAFIMNALKL